MWSLVKRRWRIVLLGLVATLLALAITQWRAAIARNRSIPDASFQIAGNLYYVGSTGVTAFLLTGPEGHVLIDGGYPETAPLIIGSIATLGFDIRDVKILLNSHAHFDHAGGLRALQEASGAELWISEGDADVVAAGGKGDRSFGPLRFLGIGRFDAPRVDRRFPDGTTIRLGPITLTAHVTGGHTPGCTSWAFPVQHGGRELLAVNICSLTLLPFMSFKDPGSYPGIRGDFERSFRRLRALDADLFLASHGSFFDLHRKRLARTAAADPVAPFIDPTGYQAFIDRADARFREKVERD